MNEYERLMRLFRLAPDGAGDDGATTGDDTGDAGDSGQTSGEATFTAEQQAYIDKLMGKVRSEERKRVAEKTRAELTAAQQKAADEAEAKRLAEQQEYQKLAAKHEKTATETAAQLEDAQAEIRRYRLEGAFRREVAAQELVFADPQAADDAFRLLDLGGVEIDDDGQVVGMDAAIKSLHDTRAYLFSQPQPIGAGINASDGRGPGAPPDPKQRETELRQRFRI